MNHNYKYSFEFHVKDFGKKITSQETVQSSIAYCDGCEWQLMVKLRDPLEVYLLCLATKRPSCRVPTSVKISLMKQDGSQGNGIKCNLIYGKGLRPHNLGYGAPSLIYKKNLMKPDSGYIKNNCITIQAEINTFRAKFGDPMTNETTWNSFADLETDAILNVDGRRIAVHRLVLAQKCQFFRRLLYPISDNEVTLNDCDFKATQTAIRFIYTHECIVDLHNLQEVLKVGKKFGLNELLLSCFELLTPENAALLASYLDDLEPEGTFLDHELKEYFWNFVQKDLQRVLTSETFWSLSDDEILSFIEEPEVKTKANPVELKAILQFVNKKNRNRRLDVEASAPSISSLTLNSLLCVICQDDSVDTMIIPCNHLCLCSKGADTLRQMNTKKCPLCQGEIKSMIKVFLP